MQIQPILGYFWAIFGLYQPPGPPFWISVPLFTYPGSAPGLASCVMAICAAILQVYGDLCRCWIADNMMACVKLDSY